MPGRNDSLRISPAQPVSLHCVLFDPLSPVHVLHPLPYPRRSRTALPCSAVPYLALAHYFMSHILLYFRYYTQAVTHRHLCTSAGLDFPALKVRTDLAAGRWSPELKSWFRSLLDKKQQFPGLFVAYVELLRDCNSAVFLAVEYGFEMAVHCLGHSCTTACDR